MPAGWRPVIERAASLPLGYVGTTVDSVVLECELSENGPSVAYSFIVDSHEFSASDLDGIRFPDGHVFSLTPERERLVEAIGRSVLWPLIGGLDPGGRVACRLVIDCDTSESTVQAFVVDPIAAANMAAVWLGD